METQYSNEKSGMKKKVIMIIVILVVVIGIFAFVAVYYNSIAKLFIKPSMNQNNSTYSNYFNFSWCVPNSHIEKTIMNFSETSFKVLGSRVLGTQKLCGIKSLESGSEYLIDENGVVRYQIVKDPNSNVTAPIRI